MSADAIVTGLGLLGVVLAILSVGIVILEVARQLKRIADAMENEERE